MLKALITEPIFQPDGAYPDDATWASFSGSLGLVRPAGRSKVSVSAAHIPHPHDYMCGYPSWDTTPRLPGEINPSCVTCFAVLPTAHQVSEN